MFENSSYWLLCIVIILFDSGIPLIQPAILVSGIKKAGIIQSPAFIKNKD